MKNIIVFTFSILFIFVSSVTFAQKSKKNQPPQAPIGMVPSTAPQPDYQPIVSSKGGYIPPALAGKPAVTMPANFSWGEGSFKDYSNTLDSLIAPKAYGEIQFFLGDSVYLIKNHKPFKTKIESGAITVLDNRIFLSKGLAGTFAKKENGTIWVTFYVSSAPEGEGIDSVSLPFNTKAGPNKPFVLTAKKTITGAVPGNSSNSSQSENEGMKFTNGSTHFEINKGFKVPLKVEVSKGREIVPGKDKLVASKHQGEPEIDGDVLPISKP